MSHNNHTSAGGASGSPVASQHNPQVAGKNVTPTAVGSGNALELAGDMSVWDTVAGKFVNVDQTTVGTTVLPKL